MKGMSAATGEGREPWLCDVSDVAESLLVDLGRGLSSAEASQRSLRYGLNVLDEEAPVGAWRRLVAQLQDPLVYLLLGAVVVSFGAWWLEGADGTPFEAIVIVAIVIVNAVFGFLQEARAAQAVAALKRSAAATATVLRDGSPQRMPAADVVPGDVTVLAEGDAVPADARLVDAASLFVAEAALTGESEAVLKQVEPLQGPAELGDRRNMVFAGTAVIRGRGRAVVTATGMQTEIGRIAELLGSTDDEATPLQREVRAIGRMLGLAVIVIAVVVIAAILLSGDVDETGDLVDVLLVGVSLAVAAVPEGLPAVLSAVLALGVQRMARERAIVKRLASVETLGSASVVCADKTGTLTRNEMTIVRVVTPSAEFAVSGTGYSPTGEFTLTGDMAQLDEPVDDPALIEELRAVLVGGGLANDASLRHEDGEWRVEGDPTEAAFLVAEAKLRTDDERSQRFERVGELPFTSERKLMSTIERDASDGHRVLITKGAPDVLLARCSGERVSGEVRHIDATRRAELLATVERLAGDALRTLAVAYRPLDAIRDLGREVGDAPVDLSGQAGELDLERDLVYVGMVGIIDPPRGEARDAIAAAHAAGVRVIMITGDHPNTALRVASDLGLVEDAGRVITGGDLVALDGAELHETVREVSVYARVAPEHKLRIVEALQADGHVVAMTGDGVNDAPALKAADIGVAMGITGTDVTREAGDMILADDNFATIVSAIREGRGILANIRKFLRFLLSSNIGEVMTMLFGVVAAGTIGLDAADGTAAVPLLATQILWINLLTDTAPALAMGLDPPPDDVMTQPPRQLSDRVINREMWFGIVWVGSVMAAVTLLALDVGLPGGLVEGHGELAEGRTMAFTTLVLAQLFNAFNARSDRQSALRHLFTNPALWAALTVSVVLQALVVHVGVLNDAFETRPLDARQWGICVGLASVVLWADEAKKLAQRLVRWVADRQSACGPTPGR